MGVWWSFTGRWRVGLVGRLSRGIDWNALCVSGLTLRSSGRRSALLQPVGACAAPLNAVVRLHDALATLVGCDPCGVRGLGRCLRRCGGCTSLAAGLVPVG